MPLLFTKGLPSMYWWSVGSTMPPVYAADQRRSSPRQSAPFFIRVPDPSVMR